LGTAQGGAWRRGVARLSRVENEKREYGDYPGEAAEADADASSLASLQHGQKRAIRTLFAVFDEAAAQENWPLFPALYREEAIELHRSGALDPPRRARLVADTIAAMTDQQALRMNQRLSGLSQGSARDPIAT
jgi:dGTP triphosphohydrolase